MINFTFYFELIAVFGFTILLIAAIIMLLQFYVCDSNTCKAFTDAANTADPGTQPYVISLLNNLYNDGIWPIPYIGASILTPLSLWFLSVPITVKTFAILSFVSFVVIYFLFSFFGHHHIRPITYYVSNYVRQYCPSNPDLDYDPVDFSSDNINHLNNNNSQNIDITFAAPISNI